VRIFVLIPTLGRVAIARRAIADLALQTRRPDGIVVVGAKPADVDGIECDNVPTETLYSRVGLPIQRNCALDAIMDRADVVLFLDDDFALAPDYLAKLETLFLENHDIIGCTGRILADGIHGRGFDFEQAYGFLKAATPFQGPKMMTMEALYGCNMAFRVSAVSELRFDENLPLYGWQEDIDFSYQMGKRGRLVKYQELDGVHLGAKLSRSPGRRLGYSQVANPIYLLRKRTMPGKMALKLISRNFAANSLKAIAPEDWVDRRGRLLGNLLAFRDLLTGRLHPRRILEFN
jgi:GT2 family glycosyltransferase